MTILGCIISATVLVSLISMIGVVFLSLRQETLKKVSADLVAFASGGLIGGAFFHLVPEAYALAGEKSLSWIVVGVLLFFVLEKGLRWRHCHEAGCTLHTFTYLNLVGDGVHNFLDGLVIAAAFLVSPQLGVVTTAVVILHEIPQEIGDFGVLIYGGFSIRRALWLNLVSALAAVLGGVLGFYARLIVPQWQSILLAVAAGSFVYVALADLVPELHKQRQPAESARQLILMAAGLAILWLGRLVLSE